MNYFSQFLQLFQESDLKLSALMCITNMQEKKTTLSRVELNFFTSKTSSRMRESTGMGTVLKTSGEVTR